MSDPRRPDDGPNWPDDGPNGPDDGPNWPERDLRPEDERLPEADAEPSPGYPEPEPPSGAPVEGLAEVPDAPRVESAAAATTFTAASGWDPRLHGERRRPTTAEQAVPWMIGVILALAGIVIVLLALIFTSPEGLIGGSSPSPSPSSGPSSAVSLLPSGGATPSPTVEPTPTAEPTVTPSPTPVPEYGPLEMVYLGRQSALAPIYLLRRDFSVDQEPTIMAQADEGVTRFAWSPDGRVGAAIIGGRAVALTPGESARPLADDVAALTFGWDSDTVYAVRITRDGDDDRTEVLLIDFVTGAAETLSTITYPHPVTGPDPALREAQFIDDGGLVRIYAVADGNLALWVLGAPAIYRVDPGDGRVTEIARQPNLWSPDGQHRITLSENANGTTVIANRDRDGTAVAAVTVTGLVSHIRWVDSNNEIVFTLGRLSSGGGVRQDLYVWDLTDGKAPMALTSNGVSFGAEWLGVASNWLP